MSAGLRALPRRVRAQVARCLAALPLEDSVAQAVICPFLDRDAGCCNIYAQRPAACRTYGFYVDRGEGLWCQRVESLHAYGAPAGVVLGNHAALLSTLQRDLGPSHSVRTWWETELSLARPAVVGR